MVSLAYVHRDEVVRDIQQLARPKHCPSGLGKGASKYFQHRCRFVSDLLSFNLLQSWIHFGVHLEIVVRVRDDIDVGLIGCLVYSRHVY